MGLYQGKISGIGNVSTRENEITADDLAVLRNYIVGWDYGVLNIEGCNFNAYSDNDNVIVEQGIMFAYGYFGYLPKKITIPFIKPSTTQYRVIYAELNKSVVPNTFKIKVKNNQDSDKILSTTFRQDYLSAIKTGIFQLPLWRIKLGSNGIAGIDGVYDIRELRDYIKQAKRTDFVTRYVSGEISSTAVGVTQIPEDNSKKLATTLFVYNAVRQSIDGFVPDSIKVNFNLQNLTTESVVIVPKYLYFYETEGYDTIKRVSITVPENVSVQLGFANAPHIMLVETEPTKVVMEDGNKTVTFPLSLMSSVEDNNIEETIIVKTIYTSPTFENVQEITRLGLASSVFDIADSFIVEKTTNSITSELAFDIVDFDKHTPHESRHTHTIDLLLHDVAAFETIPFCAPQLMYRTNVELPAGNYKFTLDHASCDNGTAYDGTYMFTTTKPIPVDGGFRHTHPIGVWKSSYAKSDVLGKYITTYGARPQRTEIETGLTVTEWNGTTECTDLGTFTARKLIYHTNDGRHNFTERQAYGSNRWRDSVIRQWLNSDAPAATGSTISNWWTPQSVFDRVPDGAKLAGFLYGLNPDFVNSLGEVEVKTTLHECDRTVIADYDITYDKVFLLSRKNVFGTDEYTAISEGELLEYFNGATDADRIKYQGSMARWWFLRTPAIIAGSCRAVNSLGAYGYNFASSGLGVVPACCII